MSEKVVLTQEQAEAIEKESYRDYENILYDYLVVSDYDEKFKGLTFGGLYRALHQGYEVEETFEVGDWVIHEPSESFGEVIRIHENELEITRLGDGYVWGKKYTRHATPEEIAEEKQRRWWKSHGRDVWELRERDLLLDDDGDFHEVSKDNDGVDGVYTMSGGFNRAYLEKYAKVVCFAENRLDVSE